ncbi:MAG TPA: GatB/YqeY domain-containing protein [Anaerolineales bacterium]
MSVKSELENALKDAMRAGNDLHKRTLRMALSAIKQTEIDKGITLDDSGVMAILQKEVKTRREAIADAERANRPDLTAASQAEITFLESFLPKELTPEELEDLARQAIAETNASSIREMGQVMKVLMPRLQGRATGDVASQTVRRLLAG